jgi:hypothetical protein
MRLWLLPFIVGALCATCLAQVPCPCDKLLQEGLYSHFHMTNTGNFNQDLRTYFLSEEFKKDFRAGRWGASLSIPIVSGLLGLDANSSDEELHEFQSKVRQETSFSVASSSYQMMVSSVPNVDLAKVYQECVAKSCSGYGFSVTPSSGSDWVVFTVTFIKEFAADPMPNVRDIRVLNGSNIETSLARGQPVSNYNTVSIRRDPKKDVVLVLDTDRGVVHYKVPADETEQSKEVPVGTIVTSILNPEQFSHVTGNNDASPGQLWTSAKSKWAPADGRIVPGSRYQKLLSQDRIPDLRGAFLRCLNVMEATPQVPLDPSRQDTEPGRTAGSFQRDAIRKHTHKMINGAFAKFYGHGTDKLEGGGDWQRIVYEGTHTVSVDDNGTNLDGEETRPRNVAVYYYIRIN